MTIKKLMNEDGWAYVHFIYLTEFIHNVLLEKAALLGRGCHYHLIAFIF